MLSDDGWTHVSTLGIQNNNNVVIAAEGGSWDTAIVVPFNPEYNGFRAILMNDDWDGDSSSGYMIHTAPDGMWYIENGVRKKELKIPPHSGVEMIGYGEDSTFKGWLVLNRIFGYENNYGFPLHVMFLGVVKDGSLSKLRTFNGEKLTSSKLGTGSYRITFGIPFTSSSNYAVFVTGGRGGSMGAFAAVTDQQPGYFDVYTGDDSSPNDSDFNFMVLSMAPAYMEL